MVQSQGRSEVGTGVQTDTAAVQVAGRVLQRLEQTPAQAMTANPGVDPHEVDLCGCVVEPSDRPTPARSAAEVGHQGWAREVEGALLQRLGGPAEVEAPRAGGRQTLRNTAWQAGGQVTGGFHLNDVDLAEAIPGPT